MNKDQAKIVQNCVNDFYGFTTKIFAESFGNFVTGDYIRKHCDVLAKNKKTIRLAFRSSGKSSLFYSWLMYNAMYGSLHKDLDIRYFSFSKTMADWHIRQIKSYLSKNPFFEEFIDMKPLAESVIQGTWNRKTKFIVRPVGIRSFTRGLKADILIIDDILSDPTIPTHPTVIYAINDIFKSVILESIKKGGQIHVAGTPMSRVDFYYNTDLHKTFKFASFPGLVKNKVGQEVSNFPELYSVKDLKDKISGMGEKVWEREIQLHPFYSEDAFFTKSYLRKNLVNSELHNLQIWQTLDTTNFVIGGLDIGKKKHPSGILVFEVVGDKAVLRHFRFMRGWKYFTGRDYDPFRPTQLEYCKEAIKNFGINVLYYDNTRGEFEAAMDEGLVPPQMRPIVFTSGNKIAMATDLQRYATNQQIEIIDDEELLTSISAVTNDLIAIESQEGHGEAFQAMMLSTIGLTQFKPSANKLTSGGKSIFEKGAKVPKGW